MITLGKGETVEDGKNYAAKMAEHMKFRRFPPERMTFTFEESEVERRTVFWIVPDGADFPSCEKCLVVKAEDLEVK